MGMGVKKRAGRECSSADLRVPRRSAKVEIPWVTQLFTFDGARFMNLPSNLTKLRRRLVFGRSNFYRPSMLSDRSYMRDSYSRSATSVLTWLMCAVAAGFVLQNLLLWWINGRIAGVYESFLELTVDGLHSGKVWTLFTYALLHSTKNILHIAGNLLAMYLLGRELLPLLGSRRFITLFLGGVLGGGGLWAATHWNTGGAVIGASAGVLALLTVYACINPNRPITFLLFFLPVTLKPKWIIFAFLALDGLGFAFYEVLNGETPLGYAHSAHLGGMAAGWLFFRFVYLREWRSPDTAATIELPRWFRRAKSAPIAPTYHVNVSPPTREDLRAEVDRILDKINSQGFGALTPEERRRLDEAKNLLSRP
jgi:membrane associated rhomboid family serine protease